MTACFECLRSIGYIRPDNSNAPTAPTEAGGKGSPLPHSFLKIQMLDIAEQPAIYVHLNPACTSCDVSTACTEVQHIQYVLYASVSVSAFCTVSTILAWHAAHVVYGIYAAYAMCAADMHCKQHASYACLPRCYCCVGVGYRAYGVYCMKCTHYTLLMMCVAHIPYTVYILYTVRMLFHTVKSV